MNDSKTYQAVRIGDIADWRLICQISEDGMSAYLKNSNPTEEVVTLFDEKWQHSPAELLRKIENTVYDHPQVLDDFTADIVLVAPKSIWVPSSMIEEDEDLASPMYNKVYKADPSDVMIDYVDDAACLYNLVSGLSGFLLRTFPGARVHSHLASMVRRFRERTDDVPRIYAEIRDRQVDIIAFDKKNLLVAATHQWFDVPDIQYHIWNIINVYGLDPSEVQLSLSGLRDVKNQLMPELRKNISYVMHTMMPSIATSASMPTPAALLLRV